MNTFLSTREVARFLGVNEKMVYSLVSEKGLPASKVTGKWLFPQNLVEQWIENNTVNFPDPATKLPPYEGLLVIAGSNDPLFDRTMSLFNSRYSDQIAVFGNLGSMGGLRALRQNLCHIASSHVFQENDEYNFDIANREFYKMPAVINFCKRDQGILVDRKNRFNIKSVKDLGTSGIRIANRPLSTGTRLLFDHELKTAGLRTDSINGYDKEFARHMDVGLEVLSGRADAAPGIKPVATLLGLGFIPIRTERFDLLVTKERFFDKGIQYFIGLLQERAFQDLADAFDGYDVSSAGKMLFPQ